MDCRQLHRNQASAWFSWRNGRLHFNIVSKEVSHFETKWKWEMNIG